MTAVCYHSPVLPWTVSQEDQQRFRRILAWALALTLTFGAAMPFLPLFESEEQQEPELPPRLVKMVLERKQQPPPPPVQPRVEPQAKPKTPPKPKPKPKPQTQPKPSKPEPVKQLADREAARQKAARSGLLALKDELADLRDNGAAASINNRRQLSQGGTSASRSERSLITANAAKGSGGINTANLSRDTGGVGLTGRSTTRVSSSIGGSKTGGTLQKGDGRLASRTIEEIQVVFDRNKGSIYSLYNRALRRDPTLQGKVVLKLTIDPSGRVTACEAVSSELQAPDLVHKLVERVKLFNFGAKEVAVMVVNYPIDFLPS
jgi:protein TonB